MMKNAKINRLTKVLTILFLVMILGSCEKLEYTQNFDDVFDTSGVKALNEKISDPGSISVLNNEFLEVNLNIAIALKNITLDEMLAHYNQSIVLSPVEIDLLLKNDLMTYLDVIKRFGSVPAQIESLTSDDFESLKQSKLNKYLLKVKAEPVDFYSTDYYTAILDMQKYLKSYVIEPMELLNKAIKTVPPGLNNSNPPSPVTILYYKIITLNNNWVMWWTYWSDGNRTKHKGAAGSFPG